MAKYHACERDLIELEPYSQNFELDPKKIKIRRKRFEINTKIKVLGFDQEGIRNFTNEQFDEFLKVKLHQEMIILS